MSQTLINIANILMRWKESASISGMRLYVKNCDGEICSFDKALYIESDEVLRTS